MRFIEADVFFMSMAGNARIRLEHGHRYDLFNSWAPVKAWADKWSKDPKNAGKPVPLAQRFPFGYFLTRLDYYYGFDSSMTWYEEYAVKNLLPSFVLKESILTVALKQMMRNDAINDNTQIIVYDTLADTNVTLTVKDIVAGAVEVIRNSYPVFNDFYNDMLVSLGIMKTVCGTKYGADCDVLVFGHTHGRTCCMRISLTTCNMILIV